MKEELMEVTVGELVREVPARSRLFEHLGIDYCCGGKKPLMEACREKELDPGTVKRMLDVLGEGDREKFPDPDALGLRELCDFIVEEHHGYLWRELPRLDFMTQKVATVHGDEEPRLHEIRREFEAFNQEMTAHTHEEETVVFPAIRDLATGSGDRGEAVKVLEKEIRELEEEHQRAGASLAKFRELTDGYTPPDWACNTFRALFDALGELEKRTQRHVHTENNILFPRAMEAARAGS